MAAFGARQVQQAHRVPVHQVQHTADRIGMCSTPAVEDSTCTQEVSVVTDKQIVLTAKRVWYFSENDEAAFFEWLDKLACVEKYEGELDVLNIYIDKAQVDEQSLREILSLFRRYAVDMSQLRVFDSDEFAAWFRDSRAYWFESIFRVEK